MVVRELITRLGFSVNQAQLNNAEKGIDRVKDSAERMAATFRNIALSFGGFAAVRSVVDIGDELQSLRTRIGQLPQTVGDAGEAMDEVGRRANASGMKLEAYGTLYTRIGNSAKDLIKNQEDLLGITDTISKALVVGGASSAEASSVMLQFSQALGSGVLQGGEFNAMAEAAPQFMDKLSESMSIPREQLKKMAADGKLTSKSVIEATKKMSDFFAERFKEMPMTVGRAMTVVSNRFGLMIDRMNRESLFITKIADIIVTGFDKIEEGIGALVKSFGDFENMIRVIGITIAVAFGAKALAILSAFKLSTLAAMLPFIKMAAVIGLVALALEDLYVWIKGGDSLIGSMIGSWESVGDTVIGVTSAIGGLIAVFAVWKVMVIGVSSALKVYEAALIAVTAVKRGLVIAALALNLALGLNPIGLIVAAIGLLIAAGALLIINWQTVKDWFFEFFGWIGDKFAALGKFVSSLFGKDIEINANVNARDKRLSDMVAPDKLAAAKKFAGGGAGGTEEPESFDMMGNAIGPAQLAPSAMGAAKPNVTNNTNVNVTVPPGTTAEQAGFLEKAAQQSFNRQSEDKLARDLSVYTP